LDEAAGAAHQADEYQIDHVDKVILRVAGAFVGHMPMEQPAKSPPIEKLDHRNQPGLAGHVSPPGFIMDFAGRFTCRLLLLCGILAHRKGDSSD
jgi:hypothetical protein